LSNEGYLDTLFLRPIGSYSVILILIQHDNRIFHVIERTSILISPTALDGTIFVAGAACPLARYHARTLRSPRRAFRAEETALFRLCIAENNTVTNASRRDVNGFGIFGEAEFDLGIEIPVRFSDL
jgi:hypothetical protein